MRRLAGISQIVHGEAVRVLVIGVLGTLLAGSVLAVAAPSAAVAPLPVSERVAGTEEKYAVAKGDTLGGIAHRYGMKVALLARINKLSEPYPLHLGQRLWVSNRHIVPAARSDGIVINLGDRTLYWLLDGAVIAFFPVGVGRQSWETPPGAYSIVGRRRDPIWHVPPSIQKEMKQRGEPVKKVVPAGPDNPLGSYWLQLSVPGYGIHGTNAPASVGKFTTHGCVRLRPEDIERLYNEVPTGTSVDVVDEPVKLARLEGDVVLLEVHQGSSKPMSPDTFIERLRAAGIRDLVDMVAALRALEQQWGIAVDVSRKK